MSRRSLALSAAFEPLAQRGVARGLALPTRPGVDVGEHVVAKGAHLRRRSDSSPFNAAASASGSSPASSSAFARYRYPAPKDGSAATAARKWRDRVIRAADAGKNLAQVEMGLVNVRVRLHLRFVRLRGLRRVAPRLEQHAEIVVAIGRSGFSRSASRRLFSASSCFASWIWLSPSFSRNAGRSHVRGERAREQLLGPREVSAAHPDVRQLPLRFRAARVHLQDALKARLGGIQAVILLVGKRQGERGVLVAVVERERLLIGVDRRIQPVAPWCGDCPASGTLQRPRRPPAAPSAPWPRRRPDGRPPNRCPPV